MRMIDEILMMTSEDVDFSNLSERDLAELALAEDPFIATEAFGELLCRKSDLLTKVACSILQASEGDFHLQSYALSALFQVNIMSAVGYVSQNVSLCETRMLNSIMELMLEYPLTEPSEQNKSTLVEIFKRLNYENTDTEELNQDTLIAFKDAYFRQLQ